jgi:uncharacterized membrane protein YgcG
LAAAAFEAARPAERPAAGRIARAPRLTTTDRRAYKRARTRSRSKKVIVSFVISLGVLAVAMYTVGNQSGSYAQTGGSRGGTGQNDGGSSGGGGG